MPIDGANAIRPYGRNSTRAGGFRATRTRRSFAACAFGANVCVDVVSTARSSEKPGFLMTKKTGFLYND